MRLTNEVGNLSKATRPLSIDLATIRDISLLLLISLYLLFNYGFVMVRPVGIPIGEVLLIVCLLMVNHKTVLPRFLNHWIIIPFSIWLFLGLTQAFIGFFQHGIWALRDATPVIESLYLYLGFAYAGNKNSIQRLKRWLPWVLGLCSIYGLTFLARDQVIAMSPKLAGGYGQPVPLFGSYITTGLAMVMFSAWQLKKYLFNYKLVHLLLCVFAITTALLIMPSRTLFVQTLLLVALFFSLKQRKKLLGILTVLFFTLALLQVLLASDVVSGTRYNADSLGDYVSAFMEIIPGYTPEEVRTSGIEQRLGWWQIVLEKWRSSWITTLFGLGYGFPLIEYYGLDGGVVREPHNDFVSILGRLGLIGLGSFLWLQSIIVSRGIQSYRYYENNKTYAPIIVALFLFIGGTLIATLGEPPFPIPAYAIPYYFIAGILLRIHASRQKTADNPVVEK